MIAFAKALSAFLKKLVAFIDKKIQKEIDAQHTSVVRKEAATQRAIDALRQAEVTHAQRAGNKVVALANKAAQLKDI